MTALGSNTDIAESPRLKDIELILRFLAFFFDVGKYKRPMSTFLDDFLHDHRALEKSERDDFDPPLPIPLAWLGNRSERRPFALRTR